MLPLVLFLAAVACKNGTSPVESDADADTDTDSDSDSDTDADTDSDADTDADTDADSDTDSDTDSDADTDAATGNTGDTAVPADTADTGTPVATADTGAAALAVQVAELLASDGAVSDELGRAVAISQDVVVVGAAKSDHHNGNSGAAYVYVLNTTTGVLTETAKLVATAPQHGSGDQFGSSVAIDGDVIVVGAIQDRPNANGRAYVFERPTLGWSGVLTENAVLDASDQGTGDAFGVDVAIDGTTVVVGARAEDEAGSQAGSVYVFEEPVGGWAGALTEDAKLIPSFNPGNNGYLGQSVAIEGDVVVSGVYLGTIGGQDDAGAGLVFVKPASGWAGTLTETAQLQQSVIDGSDRVGRSVALSNGVIALGVPQYEPPGANTNHGCVLLFEEPVGGWTGVVTESARLVAETPGSQDQMGVSVTMDDDLVVVGADARDTVRLYTRPAGGWAGTLTETEAITLSLGYAADFGQALGLDGSALVVGAPLADDTADQAGKAYMYEVGAP